MLKSFWTLSAAGIVLGGLALSLVVGPDRVSRETRAAVKRAEEAFDQQLSNAQLFASAQMELKDHDDNAAKLEENLFDVDERLDDSNAIISRLKNDLSHEEGVLRLAKLKLISDSVQFEINGRTYTRAAVEQDTEQRLQRVRDAASQMAFENEAKQRLENIRTDVAANLEAWRTARQEKARRLEVLAARMNNANVLEQLNELKSKFEHPTTDKSKFEKSVAEIERRIRDTERRANGGTKSNDGLIDWTSTKRDLVAEIDAQLKTVPTMTAKN